MIFNLGDHIDKGQGEALQSDDTKPRLVHASTSLQTDPELMTFAGCPLPERALVAAVITDS